MSQFCLWDCLHWVGLWGIVLIKLTDMVRCGRTTHHPLWMSPLPRQRSWMVRMEKSSWTQARVRVRHHFSRSDHGYDVMWHQQVMLWLPAITDCDLELAIKQTLSLVSFFFVKVFYQWNETSIYIKPPHPRHQFMLKILVSNWWHYFGGGSKNLGDGAQLEEIGQIGHWSWGLF